MQIYNKELKTSDLIEDTATPPEGWTDQSPRWTMYEAWDYVNDCWGESEELKMKAENAVKVSEARKYLSDTDWYIVRQMERQVDVPEDVATKRLGAVAVINELEVV